MRTDMQTLAIEKAFLVGIGPLILGLAVVGGLVFAVWLGIRIRDREPEPPRPEDQRPRARGVPRDQGRLTPHRLKGHGNTGTRTAEQPRHRRRWRPGRTGSFGSGGH
jgi:hypothetical protein